MEKYTIELLPNMATFSIVVKTGSFIEASVKLGITASAISRQISKLEDLLTLKLLERSTRQLRLTQDGDRVYTHCEEIFQSSMKVFALKDELSKPQGLLTFSAPSCVAGELKEVFSNFLLEYRDIDLKVIYDAPESSLLAGDIDLGIWLTDSPSGDLVGRQLAEVKHVICASAHYLYSTAAIVHPCDLAGRPFITTLNTSVDSRLTLTNGTTIARYPIRDRLCSNDIDTVVEAACKGLGVCCLPYHVVRPALEAQQLQLVLPDWHFTCPGGQQMWILYKTTKRDSQKVRALIDFLLENFPVNDYPQTSPVSG